MGRIWYPTKSKILIAIGVVIASFGLAGVVYRIFNNVVLASILVFPIRIYLRVRPVLRAPGYQDIMYGECLIPYCDQVSIVITVILSAVIYYLLAGFLNRLLIE